MCCSHTNVYTQTRTSAHSPLRVLSTTQLNGIWACVCVRLCVIITESHTHTSMRVLEWENSMNWRRKNKEETNAFDCLHQPGKLCKNRREYVDIFAIDFLSVAYRFIIAPNSTNNNTNKNTTNNIKSNCLQITSINHYIGMTNLSSTQLFWKIRNNTSAVVFADYVVAHTTLCILKHTKIHSRLSQILPCLSYIGAWWCLLTASTQTQFQYYIRSPADLLFIYIVIYWRILICLVCI